ncbi:MAG TPA: efflux RND transporter periplasmic adaptor subunit [Puia sp.]|uniref:efflux RND transporter periplasmic adaptor subunit n=1 Tax=Puia sp. TaxID=2045100 RepID=UPI002CDC9072|nr:efflux RND transporter periplasmic adaptor subunit [Puia sp.]HVU98052.1 efflux RND transporter periplasmic adaptor subunit [Puia sp.]
MLTGKLWAPALFIATAALTSCSGGKGQTSEIGEKPVPVTVATAAFGGRDQILASGHIEAVVTTNISTRVMGRITSINVKVGDKVREGELLATIGDEDIRAKNAQTLAMIDEAQAAYETAQKDYVRFSKLYQQQSATAKEADMAALQLNSAKARLDAAKQMSSEVKASLSYARLTAPFSGVVTQKMAEVGSIANPGSPILTVEKTGVLQVSATVSESDISNVHLDDSATVQVESTGKTFPGKVIQLNPSSQFTGGQYTVKISIPGYAETGLYAGMYVNVRIQRKTMHPSEDGVVLVPLTSLVSRDDLTGLYTVSAQNTASLRWLRLGRTYGDKVEVISGLAKDEKFIRSAEGRLFNGTPVVLKESTP